MRRFFFRVWVFPVIILVALLWSIGHPADATPCAAIDWAPKSSGTRQTVQAADIVQLRDFGESGSYEHATPIASLSPDRRLGVLILRQALVKENGYCASLVVFPTDGRGDAHAIADAGPVTTETDSRFAVDGLPTGIPRIAYPQWSPDGVRIAWIKYGADGSEIWTIRPDGTGARRIYGCHALIERLAWTPDSLKLDFDQGPDLVQRAQQLEREGLAGYRYGDRFWPLSSTSPFPPGPPVYEKRQIAIASGEVSTPAAPNVATLPTGAPEGLTRPTVQTSSTGNAVAWLEDSDPGKIGSILELKVRFHGRELACPEDSCRGASNLWWLDHGDTVLYVRRTGLANSQTALYRWQVGEGRPERVFLTDDLLIGCEPLRDTLLCAHEASLQPREIVILDPRSGRLTPIFDPNPEWKQLELGRARRLHWTNSFGIEAFGDLVLPPRYKPGAKLPLVIVQYHSRGFLRGGVADDYPIQLFASHGFAVLSFDRPQFAALKTGPKTIDDMMREDQANWLDRRSVNASLQAIIASLADQDLIDSAKVGITGQSDGASTVTFSLIHSDMFAAAAISTCCEDPTMLASVGPGFAAEYESYGYPKLSARDQAFWQASSLDLNLDRKAVPLLIQASDGEVRLALPTYTALTEKGWPVEMYVFPGEEHVKFWPAHRFAMYNRSVDWFERWLMPERQARTLSDRHDQPAIQASVSASSRIRP